MRIAVVQTDPTLGAINTNLEGIRAGVAAADTDLVLFPECALTGYAYGSKSDAMDVAQTIPGPATEEIAELCKRFDRYVAFGLLERDGENVFNSVALVGPTGLVGRYRKMHLLHLGVDRFTTPGDVGLPVFDLPGVRVGILICFDLSFPEAARTLKLKGAQLLLVSTNWPAEARVSCVHAPPVRAQENHFFLAACNRVGEEGGFQFPGGSRVLDPEGNNIVAAGNEPEVLRAEIDPAAADRSHVIYRPGEYELDRIATRRPDQYGLLSET